jgi:hypothetical protein
MAVLCNAAKVVLLQTCLCSPMCYICLLCHMHVVRSPALAMPGLPLTQERSERVLLRHMS